MIKWFKKLFRVIREYDGVVKALETSASDLTYRVSELTKVISSRTSIHVDVAPHMKGTHSVIMIGDYGKRDYVQTFNVRGEDFYGLLEMIRKMERYGHVDRVDAVPSMMAVMEQETNTTHRRNTNEFNPNYRERF